MRRNFVYVLAEVWCQDARGGHGFRHLVDSGRSGSEMCTHYWGWNWSGAT